jgi:HSP20 family protein
MALVVNPQPFTRDVDRLFDAFFGSREQSRRWVPAIDLVEGDDHFLLKADLPGLSQDDVSIEVQDGTLTISGERTADHEASERGWYRVERSFGSFSRSLTLPDGVDAEAISASFDRGVLEVRIPKPEVRKPRRVEIKAGGRENGGAPAVEGGTAVEGSATPVEGNPTEAA